MTTLIGSAVRPFVRIVTILLMSATTVWVMALICDRLSALHTLYHVELAHLRDQEWLRHKCKDPEFYANMTRFSTVCADVERNALQNVFWRCLSVVLHQTYLCGEQSCMRYVEDGVVWLARLSMPMMILLMVIAFVCPMMIIQFIRVCYEAFRPSMYPYQYHHSGYGYDNLNTLAMNAPAPYKMLCVDESSVGRSAVLESVVFRGGNNHHHQYASLEEF